MALERNGTGEPKSNRQVQDVNKMVADGRFYSSESDSDDDNKAVAAAASQI